MFVYHLFFGPEKKQQQRKVEEAAAKKDIVIPGGRDLILSPCRRREREREEQRFTDFLSPLRRCLSPLPLSPAKISLRGS